MVKKPLGKHKFQFYLSSAHILMNKKLCEIVKVNEVIILQSLK